ncbi:MAG: hypothetical protein ABI364_05615 [Caldimonas sp.]
MLKFEIRRIARKEICAETIALKKTVAANRSEIATLREGLSSWRSKCASVTI